MNLDPLSTAFVSQLDRRPISYATRGPDREVALEAAEGMCATRTIPWILFHQASSLAQVNPFEFALWFGGLSLDSTGWKEGSQCSDIK